MATTPATADSNLGPATAENLGRELLSAAGDMFTAKSKGPRIAHIVLMQIRADVPGEKISELYYALKELTKLVPGLLSFTGGPYSSSEGFNKNLTHGFTMMFLDAESRDGYLPHPEHERVRDMLLPLIADNNVLAFDYAMPEEPTFFQSCMSSLE